MKKTVFYFLENLPMLICLEKKLGFFFLRMHVDKNDGRKQHSFIKPH